MQKRLRIFLVICVSLFVCMQIACAEETGRIAILSAIEGEVKLLLSEAEIERVDNIGGVDYHVGTLCGQNVIIAQAGIGKTLAASGTSAMICSYPVSFLIFTGIAGGVGDETRVLDMVIANELIQHDFGEWMQDDFKWKPGHSKGEGFYFCDENLVKAARKAASEVVGKEHVFTGLIATGDQFIASETYVETLKNRFGAIACEMEGAAVAAVCEQFDIPYVIIRAMSDKADGVAHESIKNMGKLAADQSGKVVMKMLEDLSDFEKADEKTNDNKIETAYADKVFDKSRVHSVDIRFSDEDWSALLADPVSKTKYSADVVIDGETFDNVTVSTKGNSSLFFVAYGPEKSDRYSLRINFSKNEKGRTYYGLNELSLNNLYCDYTYMKDYIVYNLFSGMGVEAPLASYVWVTVNGRDQGLYMAVEDLEKGFLSRVYEGEGVIYDVKRKKSKVTKEVAETILRKGLSTPSQINGADLIYIGENLANYTDIVDNSETKAATKDDRSIVTALRALAYEKNIENHFDMDAIIRYFAIHNYLLNYDSYIGMTLNNLVLYEKDGRLSVIPRDYNLAFGTIPAAIGNEVLEDPTGIINTGIDTPLIRVLEENRPLWKLIRTHDEYLERYHEYLNELVNHLLSGECEAEIDRIHDMLLPWVQKDPTAFCTAEQFEDACKTLKQFCARRTESVRRQLAGELATVTEIQDKQSMVDASDLSIMSMGAFVTGEE